jgi:hypothetical protein
MSMTYFDAGQVVLALAMLMVAYLVSSFLKRNFR